MDCGCREALAIHVSCHCIGEDSSPLALGSHMHVASGGFRKACKELRPRVAELVHMGDANLHLISALQRASDAKIDSDASFAKILRRFCGFWAYDGKNTTIKYCCWFVAAVRMHPDLLSLRRSPQTGLSLAQAMFGAAVAESCPFCRSQKNT